VVRLSIERPALERADETPAQELQCLDDLRDPDSVLSSLRTVDWSFSDADTTYLSHDLHPYPAKFIPQLPRTLISKLSIRGELVYDPFGGSGTTALEAVLLGRRALSTDVHPISKIIGEAKMVTLTREDDRMASELAEQLWILANSEGLAGELHKEGAKLSNLVPTIPNIENWFHPAAVMELSYLRSRISRVESSNVRSLATAAFSKSILKASFQDEETRYASRPREVATGSVIKLFVANLQAGRKKLKGLGSLLGFRKAEFRTLDLRSASADAPGAPSKESVDLIVSSPPYPNCTDYHLYHRFRLFWLGYDPRDLADKEIGSHLRHQRDSSGFAAYLSEMKRCLSNLQPVLRSGRYAVLILGDGVFDGETYPTAELVGDAAIECGFERVGTLARQVHPTKRSFLSPARRLRAEQILVLRKPDIRTLFVCVAPPYKLWPYEEHLRELELETVVGAKGAIGPKYQVKAREPLN
jgi:DNA modification methylase